ncbi:MAG: 16S rRNA (cytosine(1402)-N(4))-methyltransferase RsmH, partial [Clostridia bacterium]|nr:16S rRNA (cytosine(1402)-N(4))-methyltransferase RsmH [Clostridia bacterium]
MEFNHKSVLLKEAIDSLGINPNGIYVDGTAGGAGHSLEIAKRLKSGKLFALDRDPDAVAVATDKLKGYNATVIESNFDNMREALEKYGVFSVDGVLLDLGVSSYQLDNASRGFSYKQDAPLDMRMGKSGTTAADIVNTYSANELIRIFRDYGEERFAVKIANRIVSERQCEPIVSTVRLCDIIASCVPSAIRREGNPARKCFQALRIEVNGELDSLNKVLDVAFDMLNAGGVLSVITFHSLEDRVVKSKFKELCTGCTCPPDFPMCVCGKKPRGELLNRKPILPSEEEINENQRSRSAKLRSV